MHIKGLLPPQGRPCVIAGCSFEDTHALPEGKRTRKREDVECLYGVAVQAQLL